MKKYAPLATLVAVVLLGAGLLVANMISTPANADHRRGPGRLGRRRAERGAAAATPRPPAPAPAPAPAAPAVAEKAYTGRSAGNEVTVAIAVKDGKAVAYVCDGKKIEAWMEGTLAGDTLTLSGKTSSITATVGRQGDARHDHRRRQGVAVLGQGRRVARRAVRGPRDAGAASPPGSAGSSTTTATSPACSRRTARGSPRRRSTRPTPARPRSTAARPSPSTAISAATRRWSAAPR